MLRLCRETSLIAGAVLAILLANQLRADAVVVDRSPWIYYLDGAHPNEVGVSRGKKVTLGPGTVLAAGGFTDPQQLVNGSDKDGSLCGAAPWKTPISFTVDLGRPCNIASISIMTFESGPQGAWDGQGKVLVSEDGGDFTLLAEQLSGCQVLGKFWSLEKGNYRTYSEGGTAVIRGGLDGRYAAKGVRYVRFEAPNGQWTCWRVGGMDIRTDAGLVIPHATEEVRFDADLTGWKDVPAMKIDKVSQVKQRGYWNGPEQLSGLLKLMADSQNLYVAADITKDDLVANDLRGEKATAKDCVELFLDLRDLRNASGVDFNALVGTGTGSESGYEYHVLLNPGDSRHPPQIWFMKRDSGLGRLEIAPVRGTNGAEAIDGKIQVFSKPGGKGYVIGAAIPLKNFGKAALSPGMQIGLDAALDAASPGRSGSIKMVYRGSERIAHNPREWDRVFLYKAEINSSVGKKAMITVDANTVRSFSGQDEVVRETFGTEPWASMSKHMIQAWQEDAGCFGRVYWGFDHNYSQFSLPEMDGKTEAEKRALIYDPNYWKRIDLAKAFPAWAGMEHLAKQKPKNFFILLWGRPRQLEGEPVFGRKPPSLTPEQEALAKKTGKLDTINSILWNAGPNDYSAGLCKDRDLFAELVVNLIAKTKVLMPDTRISLTFSNENNWPQFFHDKAIMDDMFDSLKKYGDYSAGPVAANEWLSQHNVLYRKIKARFPDVQVGAPDVCGIHFTDTVGERSVWRDFTVPILDKVEGMDFFDYHYGVDPNSVQIILEAVSQYVQQKRGWPSMRSVDSEAGILTFYCSTDPANQFTCMLKNQQEWFTWLRNPDLSYGWASLSLPQYFDGFGQAKGAGMAWAMFRPLRGQYIQSETDTHGVEAVASLDGNKVVCVALNNRGECHDTQFTVSSPGNASFKELQAKLLWFDAKAGKIQYAVFNPIAVQKAGGLTVGVKLPPFGTCTLEAVLDGPGKASQVNRQERYIADKVVQWVEPGKGQTFTVKLPEAALSAANRHILRVGYEKNTAGSAQVSVNGKATFELPVFTKSNDWQLYNLTELELDRSAVNWDNQITFSVKPGGNKYVALIASILTQNRVSTIAPVSKAVVNLDTASPECTITEEEAKAMPKWYADKTSAMKPELPPLLARWSFDASKNGVVADLSGHDNNGQLLNGALLSDGGIKGKSLQLDGKGACMKVNDSPTLLHIGKDQGFAISAWFRLAGSDPGVILMKSAHAPKAPGTQPSIRLAVEKGGRGMEFPVPSIKFDFSAATMGDQARTTMNLADGRWHQVVAVRDADEELSLVYIDGKYAGSGSGWLPASLEFREPLYVGVNSATNCQPTPAATDSFNGLIDEMAIYGGMLTPRQIETLHQEGR